MKAVKPLSARLALAAAIAGLSLGTATLYAAPGAGDSGDAGDAGKHHHPHGEHGFHRGRPSIERVAIGNALSTELATRTGRPAAEIQAMLKEQGPRETGEALGIDRDTMKAAMQAAHQSVLDKAVAAQLITPEQAANLAEARAQRAARRAERKRGEPETVEKKDGGV